MQKLTVWLFIAICVCEQRVVATTELLINQLQENCNDSNTDGSFTKAASNSFWSPLEQNPMAADLG